MLQPATDLISYHNGINLSYVSYRLLYLFFWIKDCQEWYDIECTGERSPRQE